MGDDATQLNAVNFTARGIRSVLWALCAVSISGEPLRPAEEFRLFSETIRGAEDNEITRCVLVVEGRKFFFIPPARWSVKIDSAKGTIRLQPEDLKAGITVKFVPEPNGDSPELSRVELRERILERHPDARLVKEFEFSTEGRTGLVFDVERTMDRSIRSSVRTAFLPCAGGRMEFELTTPADRLADYHVMFGRLLNSFHNAAFAPDD